MEKNLLDYLLLCAGKLPLCSLMFVFMLNQQTNEILQKQNDKIENK